MPKSKDDSVREKLIQQTASLGMMGSVEGMSHSGSLPRVTSQEVISLLALVHLVADIKKCPEQQVAQQFNARFNLGAITHLEAIQYDEAVRFLVDQVPDDALTGF